MQHFAYYARNTLSKPCTGMQSLSRARGNRDGSAWNLALPGAQYLSTALHFDFKLRTEPSDELNSPFYSANNSVFWTKAKLELRSYVDCPYSFGFYEMLWNFSPVTDNPGLPLDTDKFEGGWKRDAMFFGIRLSNYFHFVSYKLNCFCYYDIKRYKCKNLKSVARNIILKVLALIDFEKL